MFFGIFNKDKSTVSQNDIDQMYSGIRQCPHKRYTVLHKGHVALGFLQSRGQSGTESNPFPAYLPERNLLFAAEGRIDNVDELCNLLNIRANSNESNNTLILSAYLKWGNNAAQYLVGDWSYAAFHLDSDTLYLAHDQQGNCAMDYFSDHARLVFSTNIRALLALDTIPKRLNHETALRTLLTWNGDTGFLSFYQDIEHLSPACTLRADKKPEVQLARYWFPERIEPVTTLRDTREYAEELKIVLEEAVRARLQGAAIGSLLSGGLDSGTVAMTAAKQMAQQGKSLTTFSHVPLYSIKETTDSPRTGDESAGISAVAKAAGNITPLFFNSPDVTPVAGTTYLLDIVQSPIHAASNAFWIFDLARQAAQRGFSGLLVGDYGNATLSYTGFLNELSTSHIFNTYGASALPILARKFLRQIPHPLKRARHQKLHSVKHLLITHSYVNPELLASSSLGRDMEAVDFTPGLRRHHVSRPDHQLSLLMPGKNPRGYYHSHMGDHFGIEYRDPTADCRVIECSLRIPNEAFFTAEGYEKAIIKTMMADTLPTSVLHSRRKGLQGADLGERMLQSKGEIDASIDSILASKAACDLINMPKLTADWHYLKKSSNLHYTVVHRNFSLLLQALMIGVFVTRLG